MHNLYRAVANEFATPRGPGGYSLSSSSAKWQDVPSTNLPIDRGNGGWPRVRFPGPPAWFISAVPRDFGTSLASGRDAVSHQDQIKQKSPVSGGSLPPGASGKLPSSSLFGMGDHGGDDFLISFCWNTRLGLQNKKEIPKHAHHLHHAHPYVPPGRSGAERHPPRLSGARIVKESTGGLPQPGLLLTSRSGER